MPLKLQSIRRRIGSRPAVTAAVATAMLATALVAQTRVGPHIQAQTSPTETSTPSASATAVATAVAPIAASLTPAATMTPEALQPSATPQTAQPTASPQATGTPQGAAGGEDNLPPVQFTEESSGGGPRNRIVVINRTDSRLRIKAKVQLNHIPGDSASPSNYAEAFGSCDGCQTFAVALQIDLISRDASQVTPQNIALGVNYKCNSCVTTARALQYVIQVDDPDQVPDDVRQLVNEMNRQLNQLASEHSVNDAGQAESTINDVIAQFQSLAQSLSDQRDETTDTDTPGATQPTP